MRAVLLRVPITQVVPDCSYPAPWMVIGKQSTDQASTYYKLRVGVLYHGSLVLQLLLF
jgi:hypothetical protein